MKTAEEILAEIDARIESYTNDLNELIKSGNGYTRSGCTVHDRLNELRNLREWVFEL